MCALCNNVKLKVVLHISNHVLIILCHALKKYIYFDVLPNNLKE